MNIRRLKCIIGLHSWVYRESAPGSYMNVWFRYCPRCGKMKAITKGEYDKNTLTQQHNEKLQHSDPQQH